MVDSATALHVFAGTKPSTRSLSEVRLKKIADIIISEIKHNPALSNVDYITRESLLVHFATHPYFGRVATITRYAFIREVVTYLLDRGDLVSPKGFRNILCLSQNLKRYDRVSKSTSLHDKYMTVIAAMIADHKVGDVISVVELVMQWSKDSAYADTSARLTEDNKRVLIRHGLRQFSKAGVVTENLDYTYTINDRKTVL